MFKVPHGKLNTHSCFIATIFCYLCVTYVAVLWDQTQSLIRNAQKSSIPKFENTMFLNLFQMERFGWNLRRSNCTWQPEAWLWKRETRWTRRTRTSMPIRQVRSPDSWSLILHAAEFSELKNITVFHEEKTTEYKWGLVVVCTSSELIWIDYCLAVSRQWWMPSYIIAFSVAKPLHRGS